MKKYVEFLLPAFKLSRITHIKAGLAFGLSQLSQYLTFAAMFYFAGLILKNSIDAKTGLPTIQVGDVFCALFAIMFAASQAGMA